jgi:hypothetical protein
LLAVVMSSSLIAGNCRRLKPSLLELRQATDMRANFHGRTGLNEKRNETTNGQTFRPAHRNHNDDSGGRPDAGRIKIQSIP